MGITRTLQAIQHGRLAKAEEAKRKEREREAFDMPQRDIGLGRVLGRQAATERNSPPQEGTQETRSIDRTPSAKAKVLPWVQGVETEAFEPPEGMFGPYDSQPPTRPQTLFESVAANHGHAEDQRRQQRSAHPFAYTSAPAPPLAAIELDTSTPVHGQVRPSGRPESDVLSRGAGMRFLSQDIDVHALGMIAEEDPARNSVGSVGMGTFGREASKELPAQDIATPSHKPRGYEASPQAKSGASAKTASPAHNDHHLPDGPRHVHKPHHEHQFSHIEAARQQAEGIERARREALSALQSARIPYGPPPTRTDPIGPRRRQTYETIDSGPSFGHILHGDGMPMTQQPDMYPLPFGLPMGAAGRPMLVMRGGMSTNAGFGLFNPLMGGLGGLREDARLSDVQESPDNRKTSRSAYVESVEDEQEPAIPGSKTVLDNRSHELPDALPAKSESNIQPARHSIAQADSHPKTTNGHKPRTAKIANLAPSPQTTGQTVASTSEKSAAHAPTVPGKTEGSSPRSQPSHSTMKAERTAVPLPASDAETAAPSVAPTTTSNVKRLVSDSKFHDETLCQLLDAARLNLIGGEAKKALNRAARARVVELRNMKKQAEQEDRQVPTKKDRSASGKTAQSKQNRGTPDKAKVTKAQGTSSPMPPSAASEPSVPPVWASEIIARLEAFDLQFNQLERRQQEIFGVEDNLALNEPMHDVVDQMMLEHLTGIAHGHGVSSSIPFGFVPADSNPEGGPYKARASQGAQIHSIATTVMPLDEANEVPSWGSDVELPHSDRLSGQTPLGPTINIQPPTESNARTQRAPTASARSVTEKTARSASGKVPLNTAQVQPTVRPLTQEMKDRSLPDTPPSESMSRKSRRQSPLPAQPSAHVAPHIGAATSPQTQPRRAPPASKSMASPATTTNDKTVYDTAVQDTTPTDEVHRDKLHIHLKSTADDQTRHQWDRITQRLYSWAMVWDEPSFVRAMQSISLGEQVQEFPLSIFVMTTFKRYIRYSLSLTPPLHCDKLFVPPNMADAISKAVHSKSFSTASKILHDLWYPFGFTEPPRVIIALAKHRTDADHWVAHRFDCVTHKMTSYSLNHQERHLPDGRPFMWWHAIRHAWPEYSIPDLEQLQQRFVRVQTTEENKGDNSLLAANYARNLFLGYRPERETDLQKMRSMIWDEVKTLLQKKREGNLLVDSELSRHTFDV